MTDYFDHDDSERRTKKLELRITPKEKRRLDRLARQTGITKAEFVRRASFNRIKILGVKQQAPVPTWKLDAVREINRIGVNINQLTRHMHQMGMGHTPQAAILESMTKDLNTALSRLL